MKTPTFNPALLPLLIAAVLLIPVTADAKRPSKNTVLYIRANADELINTEVTVDVSWMQEFRGALAPKVPGYTAIRVHTWDDNQNIIGGAIGLLVPEAEAKALLKKFPTVPDVKQVLPRSPETSPLKATLREGRTGNLYLDLDGTAGAVVKAIKDAARQP